MIQCELPLSPLVASEVGHRTSATRRIDITIERLGAVFDGLSAEQQARLAGTQWWNIAVLISRVRAMERSEGEITGRINGSVADAYDRVVHPGGDIAEAMLSTFRAAFPKAVPDGAGNDDAGRKAE